MSSPASLTCRCLSSLKALWKLCCDCLTSIALALCALWSAALLSASLQVSWEIQDAHAFVGLSDLEIYPLRTTKDAPTSVWGRIAFVRIGQRLRPVGNGGYIALPLPVAPPGLSCGMYHDVSPVALS